MSKTYRVIGKPVPKSKPRPPRKEDGSVDLPCTFRGGCTAQAEYYRELEDYEYVYSCPKHQVLLQGLTPSKPPDLIKYRESFYSVNYGPYTTEQEDAADV